MTTSAARDLAEKVLDITDNAHDPLNALSVEITAALKRCRNEALEEASHKVHSVLFDLTMSDRYAQKKVAPVEVCYTATREIKNLKEAE